MTLEAEQTAQLPGETTFASYNPATGEVVGTFPAQPPGQVDEAVDRGRDAAAWWWSLGWSERRSRLLAWKKWLAGTMDELAELVHRENGKTVSEATIELIAALEVLDWAARHAKNVLGPRTLRRRMLTPNLTTSVEYHPYGVVGVIGTWNWPVFTPMGAVVSALAAGNSVVFKPSELTPAVGAFWARGFMELVPEAPVLQVVQGLAETGAALSSASLGKLSFVGSERTARRIMAACAEKLTPLVLELGGKDALIVDDDADVDAAAGAALWSGMGNSGQTCIGIERVYVTEPAYDGFVAALKARASEVHAGAPEPAGYGPMDMAGQVDVVRRHVADALERGATAVVGGLESIRAPYIDPIVLVDVPDDAPANTEETFGPVLTVAKVATIDEAVAKANATELGLGAAIFSKSRGTQIARRLRTGMTSVNSVMSFAGAPGAPFGGVGLSGFGRVHGADGLREFAWVKTIAVQRFSSPVELLTFRRKPHAITRAKKMAKLIHGR
jgi:acyl-CoA reductase-like NAD-dependent aldehyde dehydrogenase